MDIDMTDFAKYADRRKSGTPCGHGWGRYFVTCPRCKKRFEVVRIAMTKAEARCPRCRHKKVYTWPVADPSVFPAPCDGAWLEPVGWEKTTIITRN